VELEFEIIESRLHALLNLCCALEHDLESIFRAGVLKIVLQQNRPITELNSDYSALMPAALMMGHHLSTSAF
jgi:hypothetical protein